MSLEDDSSKQIIEKEQESQLLLRTLLEINQHTKSNYTTESTDPSNIQKQMFQTSMETN